MSGPGDANFSHGKLDRPMEYPNRPNNCYWFTFTPSPFVHPPRATQDCKKKCVTRAICLTQMVRFNLKRDDFDLLPEAGDWTNPNETSPDGLDPDNIWISGTGGKATTICLEGKWWVLFGVYEKRRPANRPDLPGRSPWIVFGSPRNTAVMTRVYVLHEMTWEPWSSDLVEVTRQKAKAIFLREEK